MNGSMNLAMPVGIEIWQDGELAGGIYGVAVGGLFAGESMFFRRRDASKVALVYLIEVYGSTGFTLFDTQFLTPHTASIGRGRDLRGRSICCVCGVVYEDVRFD